MTQIGAELESANTQTTSGDAVSETEAYGRARAQGDDAIERSCMVCGNKFESEGWHNRLCGSCRKRSVAAGCRRHCLTPPHRPVMCRMIAEKSRPSFPSAA